MSEFITREELLKGLSGWSSHIEECVKQVLDSELADLARQVQDVRTMFNDLAGVEREPSKFGNSLCDGMVKDDYNSKIEFTRNCESEAATGDRLAATLSGPRGSARTVGRRRRRQKQSEKLLYTRGQLLQARSTTEERPSEKVKATPHVFVPERPPGLDCCVTACPEMLQSDFLVGNSTWDVEWGPYQSAEWCTLPSVTPSFDQFAACDDNATTCCTDGCTDVVSTTCGQTGLEYDVMSVAATSSVEAVSCAQLRKESTKVVLPSAKHRCKHFLAGACERGSSCGYAHGFELEDRVRIQGLTSESGLTLNNLRGIVKDVDTTPGRVGVLIDGGGVKAIKSENLSYVYDLSEAMNHIAQAAAVEEEQEIWRKIYELADMGFRFSERTTREALDSAKGDVKVAAHLLSKIVRDLSGSECRSEGAKGSVPSDVNRLHLYGGVG